MLDIDNLPIGIKPTNKMTFEDLIEEKLKIADQLEKEQSQLNKSKKKLEIKKITTEEDEEELEEEDTQEDVEIEIQNEQQNESETDQLKTKPKPFLKRGEGLKRYQPSKTKKMHLNQKKISNNKNNPNNNQTNTNSLNRKSTSSSNLKSNSQTKITTTATITSKTQPQKPKPEVNSVRNKPNQNTKTVQIEKKPIEKKIEKPIAKEVEIVKAANSDEDEDEFYNSNYFKPKQTEISKPKTNSITNHHDDNELKEFEKLEQYLEEHPSFRSSASYVETFFSNEQNSNQFRYEKNEIYQQNHFADYESSSKITDILKEMNLNEKITIENIYKNYRDLDEHEFDNFILKNIENTDQLDENELENRTILEDEVKYHNTSNTDSNKSVLTRKIKRIYKKEDDQDSFLNENRSNDYKSSNYKDYEDDNDEFQVSKVTETFLNQEHENEKSEEEEDEFENFLKSSNDKIKKVKFDDTSSWLDQSNLKANKKFDFTKDNEDKEEEDDKNLGEIDYTVTSNLISKLFPSLKQQEEKQKQALLEQQKQKDKQLFDKLKHDQINQINKTNNPSLNSNINANLLKEKINQLETEIEKFQKKNSELTKLKEKLETEIKLAETNRKLIDKQKQEEFNRLKELHEEEMKKLKQEKKIFEQYKQSIKEKPDRKEREEIERLQKQVIELNEELKTRESRWMANNNRLKERIEALEKEKSELKKELQYVEKQRIDSLIKMTSSQPSNTNSLPVNSTTDLSRNFHKNQLTVSTNSFNSESEYQNGSNMYLKRTTSEKSLPNSSPSSSSSSIGSTGSLALHSNLNHLNLVQQQTRSINSISSPLTSNSFDSIKSDYKVQNHKTMSPNNHNVIKTVKFNHEHLKETRYYSPSSTNLNENDEYEYEPSYTNETRPVQQEEYVISSLSGVDRKLKVKEARIIDGKQVDKLLEDDTLLTIFTNGTIKEVSADKKKILVKFFNGDRKEMNRDTGTETYFYAETNITQIIYSNGLEILKFPNGQIEKHHIDKTREIIFPDKICKFIYPDCSEETRLPNGTCIRIDKNGDKVIEYPNKQREIHTKEFKRREYPDGSVKTIYTNGLSETKYANGRVRLKDSLGNIISDNKI